jgi:hypothetical protein
LKPKGFETQGDMALEEGLKGLFESEEADFRKMFGQWNHSWLIFRASRFHAAQLPMLGSHSRECPSVRSLYRTKQEISAIKSFMATVSALQPIAARNR